MIYLNNNKLSYYVLLAVGICCAISLNHPIGKLPALGPLLSPFTGFWQNSPQRLKSSHESFDWKTLKQPVTVVWDDFRVPHIFAKNSDDLYQVQGYLHARDRLFQMDLTSRAGMSRLSEIIGSATWEIDQFFGKLGLRQGIQNLKSEIESDPESRKAMGSYISGVNRWIEDLPAKKYPLEYKLLNTLPEKWTLEKSAAIVMVMTFRLGGRSYDLWKQKHLSNWGAEKIKVLFPNFLSDHLQQTYPQGVQKIPQKIGLWEEAGSQFKTVIQKFPETIKPLATNGSNNWAIRQEESGAIEVFLANDPHLKLNLPTLWYEQQLSVEDSINMYGVSIPGAAGLQIGFSPQVGWGVTNGNSDVLDWFEVEFKTESSNKYLWHGEWLEANVFNEQIVHKNGEVLNLEILSTQAGRVFQRNGKMGLAFQWTGITQGGQVATFLKLTKSRNYSECVAALKFYEVPAQNFICSGPKDISIHHQGKIPLRKKIAGSRIQDGRKAASEWQSFIPQDELPHVLEPKHGFVFSANQRVASQDYPYYLSWDFAESYRAQRIWQQLIKLKNLPSHEKTSLDHLAKMQTDTKSLFAQSLLPFLLEQIENVSLSEFENQALKILRTWDYNFNPEKVGPSLFNAWWLQLEEELFADAFGPPQQNAYPRTQRTVELLLATQKPNVSIADYWFLKASSKLQVREIVKSKVLKSFRFTLEELKAQAGPAIKNWTWATVAPSNIKHLLQIKGLGRDDVPTPGGAYTVNVKQNTAGASWRQLVKLGHPFEARVNLPGGNSGNPFDPNYDEFLDDWVKGKYRTVHFFDSLGSAQKKVRNTQ